MNGTASTRPIVVKIGGAVAESSAAVDALLSELGELAHSGRRVLLVHGGGRSVTELSLRLGLEPTFVDGIRLTTTDEMDVVDMILAGLVNTALVRRAGAMGIPAVGLTGADASLLQGTRISPDSRTARPYASTTAAVDALWAANLLPIVAPVGSDAQFIGVNINADDAAQKIAEAVGPGTTLCYISDVSGVRTDSGDTISVIRATEIEPLIASGTAHGGMAAKLRASARALESGVGAVVIGDAGTHGDLASLLTRERGSTIVPG